MKKDITIVKKKLSELTLYENNPRHNEEAVDYVANSIKRFGFKVPMIIDKDGVIVSGHTRYKACEQLGIEEVPCVLADDLTEEEVKALRLADNKVAEKAGWDYSKLDLELEELLDFDVPMTDFGFVGDVDLDIDDLFEETENTGSSEPKTIVCPHCGETITL